MIRRRAILTDEIQETLKTTLPGVRNASGAFSVPWESKAGFKSRAMFQVFPFARRHVARPSSGHTEKIGEMHIHPAIDFLTDRTNTEIPDSR